jgi:syntaxin-binding protein 5
VALASPLASALSHATHRWCAHKQSNPYQLLVAHHHDLTINFYDCSSQLLSSTAALRFEYPQLVPHLTIKVQTIIRDPSLAGIVDPQLPASISGLHLSPDAQHCGVVLASGHVLLFRFTMNGPLRVNGLSESLDNMDDTQNIVVILTDLGQKRGDGFRPVCLLDARRGDITAMALSDEGESLRCLC